MLSDGSSNDLSSSSSESDDVSVASVASAKSHESGSVIEDEKLPPLHPPNYKSKISEAEVKHMSSLDLAHKMNENTRRTRDYFPHWLKKLAKMP